MATETQSIPDTSVDLSLTRRALILMTLTFVTMLYTMSVMIANVALPKMQGTFAATTDQIALVVTFNIVATAVATPISGWLASRFSRRSLMLFCSAGFTIASVGCGIAGTLEEMVIFRIFQGAFGAPLVPLSQAAILDTFPKEQHGTATAVFSMGVVFGPIIGPTVGGYLAEELGWRWVFFLLVPFGMLACASIFMVVRDKSKDAKIYLDWFGFLSLSVAIASFQFMLDRGQRLDWFESPEIMAEAAIAALAIYWFISHVLTSDRPFLNLKIFADRNYTIGFIMIFMFGMILWTPMVLLPPMMEQMRGFPEGEIGLFIAIRSFGTLFTSILMAFINRMFDPRLLLTFGFVLQGVAGLMLAGLDVNLATDLLVWSNLVAGIGAGFIWVPITLITFATLDKKYLNEASAFFHLIRNVGSSIFISLSVALVIRSAAVNYADLVPFVSIFGEGTSPLVVGDRWELENTGQLSALSKEVTKQAVMIGYINAYYLFSAVAFAIIPLIAFVRLNPKDG